MWASCGEQETRNRVTPWSNKMHKYRQDEWVIYHQFPGADAEWLRKGKRAVILEHLENNRYRIYVDDPDLDEKWRIKKVNEADLEPID